MHKSRDSKDTIPLRKPAHEAMVYNLLTCHCLRITIRYQGRWLHLYVYIFNHTYHVAVNIYHIMLCIYIYIYIDLQIHLDVDIQSPETSAPAARSCAGGCQSLGVPCRAYKPYFKDPDPASFRVLG